MPFKSEAQRRKFAEMVRQGKMSQETFNEWNSETPTKIPERVAKPKKPKKPKKPVKGHRVRQARVLK